MYNTTIKIKIISTRDTLEKSIEGAPAPDGCRYEIETVQDISEPMGLDSAAIIDGNIAQLAKCGEYGADYVVFVLDARNIELLNAALFEKSDAVWTVPAGAVGQSIVRNSFSKLLVTMKEKSDLRHCRICLDTAIDSMPDLVWFKDTIGAHLTVNDAFCAAVAKTKDQIRNKGHYYIWDTPKSEYDSGDFVCIESEVDVINKRKTCVFDEKVKTKSGMRRFMTYKSPLIDTDGSIFGTCGIAHDVTDLRHVTDEISLLLTVLPFAAAIEDKNGKIMVYNKRFENLFDDGEELIGKEMSELKSRFLPEIEEQAESIEFERVIDGEPRTFVYRVQPLYDIFDEKIGKVTILRDVTIERNYNNRHHAEN